MDVHFYFFVCFLSVFFLFPTICLRVTYTAIWEETFKYFLDENTMETLLTDIFYLFDDSPPLSTDYVLNVYITLHYKFYWVKIDDMINSSTRI